jgi:deoxyribodipyrimidine photo-lyase
MRPAVMLFTRDLRVHDQPALTAATREFEHVIPLFVLDDRLLGSANRTAFLLESLSDLRRALGGSLVVRRGDPVAEVAAFEPEAIFLSADVTAYARARERRLREVAEVRAFPGVAIVDPGSIVPQSRDHYRVFTPYYRTWEVVPRRTSARPVREVRLPAGIDRGSLPSFRAFGAGAPSRDRPRGGETAGRARLDRFLREALASYDTGRDHLAAGASSQLSPYLRFGCVSPLEAACRAARRAVTARPPARLARLHLQLLAANPRLAVDDLRSRGDTWRDDPEALEAWRAGKTGIPVVDAGMRQLRAEGWMHNRARLLAASYLVKHLNVDWRLGAAHFSELLVDGDPASNSGNWQWVAGTEQTRPNESSIRSRRRVGSIRRRVRQALRAGARRPAGGSDPRAVAARSGTACASGVSTSPQRPRRSSCCVSRAPPTGGEMTGRYCDDLPFGFG